MLVARSAERPAPRAIVAGVDGSPESRAAYAVAADLAERLNPDLWPLVATAECAPTGPRLQALTKAQPLADSPSWSPGGRVIAFAGLPSGPPDHELRRLAR